MFSKTIKYKDFNGDDQEKTFWFHLSNAKLAVLAASGDSMQGRVQRMVEAKDNVAVLEELRTLIRMSCGIRSDDGQRFIQTEEAQSQLLDSPAFDELLFELFVGDNAVKFFTALVPPEQGKQIEELAKKQLAVDPFKNPPSPDRPGEVVEADDRPAYQKENRRARPHEMRAMTREEMVAAFEWEEKNGLRGKQAE